MTLSEFQQKRNEEARQLKTLSPSKRYEKACKVANKYVNIACEHGFITQTYHHVFLHAGLLTNPQKELFG